MRDRHHNLSLISFSCLLLFGCLNGFAESMVIPNVCASEEGDAFTGAFAVPIRQQEVYSASQFPASPIVITELRFRPDVQWGARHGAFSANLSKVQFRLSTTIKGPGGLSYNFSENTGVDEVLVYDAPWQFQTSYIGPVSGPKAFDIILKLEKPFPFDGSKGNLLVDLRNFGRAPLVYVHDDSRYGGLCQRIFIEDPAAEQAASGDLSAAVMEVVYEPLASAPEIRTHPSAKVGSVGGNVEFTVVAIGTSPLSYQWSFNDEPIPGASSRTLTLSNISTNSAGFYSVVVSNALGWVVSSKAELSLQKAVAAKLVVPKVASNVEGDAFTAAFAVPIRQQEVYSASQFPPKPMEIQELRFRPDIQWGLPQGAFSAPLSKIQFRLSTTTKAPGELSHRFAENIGPDETLVYDAPWTFGTHYTGPAVGPKDFDIVVKLQKPFIYDPAKGNLLVEVRNYGRAPAIYVHDDARDFQNVQRIFIENPDADQAAGGDRSAAVLQLILGEPGTPIDEPKPPALTLQPQSTILDAGRDALFVVSANGTPPLFYQWFFNGLPIEGANASSLSLVGVNTNQAGLYSAVISNALGSQTSVDALLTVLDQSLEAHVVPVSAKDQEGDAYTAAFAVPLRQQEVYYSSQFPVVPINIIELRYRPDIQFGASQGAFSSLLFGIEVRLSTTLKQPGGLSSPFGSNAGSDEKLVYEGPWKFESQFLGPPDGPKQFDIVLRLQKPFHYDPSKGNLLVDIKNYGGTSPAVYVHDDSRSDLFLQRIFNDNPDSNEATSSDLSAAVLQLGYVREPARPVLIRQPSDKIITYGENVLFEVGFEGSSPLSFQWFYDGNPIPGATSNSYSLVSAGYNHAGKYSVEVSNLLGSVRSRDANLQVLRPPPKVLIGGARVPSGGELRLPLHLLASGKENGVACSFTYNRRLLSFVGIETANEFRDSFSIVNTNDLALSRIGFALILDSGESFPEGTNVVAYLTFSVTAIVDSEPTMIAFGDLPVAREVVDITATPLRDAVFQASSIEIVFSGFEGDVAPRPGGDRRLTVADWVQVGRFVSGLDDPGSEGEYQRIDCAPAISSGDGKLSIKDWVQSGRYTANLDPLVVVGGPTSNLTAIVASARPELQGEPETIVALREVTGEPGATVVLPLNLQSVGGEAALGLSVRFDPAALVFVGVDPGPDSGGGILNVNTRFINQGRIGLALALPGGAQFSAGDKTLASLKFVVRSIKATTVALTFDDLPVVREVVDAAARDLPVSYFSGAITVTTGAPELLVSTDGTSLIIRWSAAASDFTLEVTRDLHEQVWTSVTAKPQREGDFLVVRIIRESVPETFFRLKR